MAGGVPEDESLSAAFNNLAEPEALTARYSILCEHYAMGASRDSAGVSHGNGVIEARQGRGGRYPVRARYMPTILEADVARGLKPAKTLPKMCGQVGG